jgi:ketosteroid isomerase-like protein
VPQGAGARKFSDPGIHSPEELVKSAYRAFARRDRETLRSFCHPTLELRPVDALGLVGDPLRGFDAACRWVKERDEGGYRVTVWPRTLECIGPDHVLGVGVVSAHEQGCAATVAWIWHVRDGLIDSVTGYSNEAAARRSFSAQQA